MQITTKNIDKLVRTFRRSIDGLRVDTTFKCCSCNKKIRGNKYIAVLNGMGGFNYYHRKHILELNIKDKRDDWNEDMERSHELFETDKQ